jgi:hypothetical protein
MGEFIYNPALSTLTSILLIIGCYELGNLIINRSYLKKVIQQVSIIEFQYIAFGLIFLSIILFPLVAFTSSAKLILQFFSIILILLCVRFFFRIKPILKKIKINKKRDIFFYIFLIFILLYFLLGLSPLTSADVLDYHVGAALNILRFDRYILLPEWFTSLQSGGGEVLIALGLSVGSEQFGSLVQFSSILTISGIILKFSENQKIFSSKYFLILLILSCPILIFLLSGNKPQIFYSSLILLALALNFKKQKNEKDILITYLVINILICCAVIGKFSFNLTGFLIWFYSTINFINKKNFVKLLSIPLIVFILVYFPFILWKFENLGGHILTYMISPFPLHLPGYENFLSHNKGSQQIPFPYFLFYTTPSRATEFLALNTLFFLILLFFFKQNKKIKVVLILSTLYVLISNLYASPSARYYLDIILWLSLGITTLKSFKNKILFQYIYYPQILSVLIILIYSVWMFLPGSFSQKSYLKIKHNHAYMYSGMEWVNRNIPDNSSVIIINRPISQFKDFAISGNFNYFTDEKTSMYYKNLIKKYNPKYLVYLGNDKRTMNLTGCITGIYKKKDNVGFHATRNPFNKGSYYNAYIFHFDYLKLPNC